MKEKLKSYYGANFQTISNEVVRILTDLVKEKTVNVPKKDLSKYSYLEVPGQESKAAAVVTRELDKIGIKYKVHEQQKGRANVLGYYGDGPTSLLVGAHMDVVPPGDGWSSDPFTTYVKDGLIYGRGVIDNKGPLAATIVALKILKEQGVELKGSLIMGAIASEEFREPGEMDPGLEYLMKNNLLKPTYAIIPDIGENMKKIDIAEKGRLQMTVTSYGKQAHGSTPERGVNAVIMMGHYLTKLQNLNMKFKHHHYLVKPSLNVGIIQGGSASNIVPAECEVTLDIRFLPGQTPEGIVEELKEISKNVEGKFEFKIQTYTLPHEVDPDNILVKALQKNSQDILGQKAEPFGMGGGTFAKGFNLAGITAVGFGPGDDNAFHIANEYIEIRQLVQFAQLISATAIDILGTK